MSTDVKKMAFEASRQWMSKLNREQYMDTVLVDAYEQGYLAGFEAGSAREGEWVYCSDRMPTEAGDYLTAFTVFKDPMQIEIDTTPFDGELWGVEACKFSQEESSIYAWRPIQPITPPPIKL